MGHRPISRPRCRTGCLASAPLRRGHARLYKPQEQLFGEPLGKTDGQVSFPWRWVDDGADRPRHEDRGTFERRRAMMGGCVRRRLRHVVMAAVDRYVTNPRRNVTVPAIASFSNGRQVLPDASRYGSPRAQGRADDR